MYCHQCGKEIQENHKFCPYCGTQKITPEETVEKDKDVNFNANENNQNNKEITEDKGSFKFLGIIFAIVCCMFITAAVIQNCSGSTKIKPDISTEETLTGIVVTIDANDDYEKVEVLLEFTDGAGNVIEEKTLTGYNYKKGRTYTLNYYFSLSDLFEYSMYTCQLKDYR